MSFEVLNQNEYILIRLEGVCSGDEKPTVYDHFSTLFKESGLKLLVIQASNASMMTAPLLRQLSMVYKDLKAVNGKIRMVGANETVLKLVQSNGLDRILVNKMSMRGALVDLGLAKAKDFDVNFINPFLNATLKTFKIQCFMESKPGKPYLKKPSDPLLLGDVSGIISITSETFTGTLAISISETIFKKIATNMLGEECSVINDENIDLIGELANIILGQAKIELSNMGYGIQMALPSCVWGKDHKIKHFGGGMCMVIPFETDVGTFYTEIMTNNSLANQLKKAA